MWNPNLKSKTDEINFIGSNLLLITLSIFLLFGNGINIKNKAIAVIRIALNCASISLTAKVIKETSIWLLEDYSDLEKSKRKARKLISQEQIIIDTDDSINAIHGLTEEIEEPQSQSYLVPFDWKNLRNSVEFPHLAIKGKTGSGKSTLASWCCSELGGKLIAVAPHYAPGDYPSADLIIGKGRDYGEKVNSHDYLLQDVFNGEFVPTIADFIKCIHNEMTYRYNLPNYSETEPINIILDEYNAYSKLKGCGELIKQLLREARKVNLRLIFLVHGSEVESLGVKGEGSIRLSLTFILLGNFANEEVKSQLNKLRLNSPDYNYWEQIKETFKNSNRPCLVDDNYALIPDLSNWSNHNPDQIILERNKENFNHTTTTTIDVQPLYDEDYQVCGHCGSDNIKKHSSNRIMCRDCGKTSTINAKKK